MDPIIKTQVHIVLKMKNSKDIDRLQKAGKSIKQLTYEGDLIRFICRFVYLYTPQSIE